MKSTVITRVNVAEAVENLPAGSDGFEFRPLLAVIQSRVQLSIVNPPLPDQKIEVVRRGLRGGHEFKSSVNFDICRPIFQAPPPVLRAANKSIHNRAQSRDQLEA
jgi:hypothetical protein